MPPKIKRYSVWYKAPNSDNWQLNGFYNKTDALGTAGLYLIDGYTIKICPKN